MYVFFENFMKLHRYCYARMLSINRDCMSSKRFKKRIHASLLEDK